MLLASDKKISCVPCKHYSVLLLNGLLFFSFPKNSKKKIIVCHTILWHCLQHVERKTKGIVRNMQNIRDFVVPILLNKSLARILI